MTPMRLSLSAALLLPLADNPNRRRLCRKRLQPPCAPPWFICDAINAPVLLVFERDGATARVAQYDKPNGALIQRTEYTIGAEEGAAGSVYTALLQNGAEAGHVRQINPGMLETPGAAYTTPFTRCALASATSPAAGCRARG